MSPLAPVIFPGFPTNGLPASVCVSLGVAHPQQHSAKHQASGTLPILKTPTAEIDAKLSSEVDGHLAREGGRAGLSPALPPPLGSWDLALPAWHSGSPSAGSTPPQLAAFPATLPHSLTPRLLSPPLAPPLPPPTRAPALGPLGLGGVN